MMQRGSEVVEHAARIGPGKTGRLRGDLLVLALLAVAGAVYHGVYFFAGPTNLFDTGVLLSDASRLARGEMFGRDFIAPYGPARYDLLALFFAVVPPSLLSFDIFLLILHALLDAWAYLLARRVASRPLAVAFTLLFIVAHGAAHKVFLLLGTVMILERLAAHAARPDRRRAFLLGMGVGVAGLLRVDLGGFGLIAAAAAILAAFAIPMRRRLVQLLLLGAGGLVVAAASLSRLVGQGVLLDWVDETVTRIVIQMRAESPAVVQATSFGWEPLKWLAVGGLAVAYALAGLWLVRRWRRAAQWRSLLLGAIVLGVLLLNQLFLEIKLDRLLHSAPPCYLLALCGAAGLELRGGRCRSVIRIAAFALPVLLLVWVMTAGRIISQGSPRAALLAGRTLELERGGVRLRPGMADRLEGVVREVTKRSPPGEPIYCGHACPVFYFLLDRPNVTRYTEPSYIADNPEAQRRVVAALERYRPRVVILKQVLIAGFGMARNGPVIWPYLMSRYRTVAQYGAHFVLERKEP